MEKKKTKAFLIASFFKMELPNAEKQQKLLISALYPYRGDFLEKKRVKFYAKLRLKEFSIFFPSSRIRMSIEL